MFMKTGMFIILLMAFLWTFDAQSASVTNYEVLSNSLQGESRIVVYRYELLDNNSLTSFRDWGPRIVNADADLNADMAVIAPAVLVVQAADELQNAKLICESNIEGPLIGDGNPLFFYDGWWQQESPAWNTWTELFEYLSYYYWSQEDHLSILAFAKSWGLISSGIKKDLGPSGLSQQQVTAMDSDISIAIDTAETLNTYIAPLDDEGNWIRP